MTAVVRLEWVEGPHPTTISLPVGVAQDLSVTGLSVTVSAPCPSFQGLDGYARLVCSSGAVVAAVGNTVAANSGVVVNSLTGPVFLAISPGQTVALIEDATMNAGGSGVGAIATANAPVYADNASVDLSTDLSGNLRVLGGILDTTSGHQVAVDSHRSLQTVVYDASGAPVDYTVAKPTSPAYATANAPVYAQNTTVNLSTDLAGHARVLHKPSSPVPAIGVTNTAMLLVGTTCTMTDYVLYNPNGNVVYVHLFDAALANAVILGTTVPVRSLPVPPSSAAHVAGFHVRFNNGLVVAATLNAGADSNAVTTPINAGFGYY